MVWQNAEPDVETEHLLHLLRKAQDRPVADDIDDAVSWVSYTAWCSAVGYKNKPPIQIAK